MNNHGYSGVIPIWIFFSAHLDVIFSEFPELGRLHVHIAVGIRHGKGDITDYSLSRLPKSVMSPFLRSGYLAPTPPTNRGDSMR